MDKEKISIKISNLPPHLQRQVSDYIDFLAKKHDAKRKAHKFNFNWGGELAELGKQLKAVDLQHKAADWRYCTW